MKAMEGYENPFTGVKEPRKLVVDRDKLKLQEELGMFQFGVCPLLTSGVSFAFFPAHTL